MLLDLETFDSLTGQDNHFGKAAVLLHHYDPQSPDAKDIQHEAQLSLQICRGFLSLALTSFEIPATRECDSLEGLSGDSLSIGCAYLTMKSMCIQQTKDPTKLLMKELTDDLYATTVGCVLTACDTIDLGAKTPVITRLKFLDQKIRQLREPIRKVRDEFAEALSLAQLATD